MGMAHVRNLPSCEDMNPAVKEEASRWDGSTRMDWYF
ncbi:uncharacterized protein FTOL_13675 [Fusarium torulosum]|uniref:Uncharacterized protein n=1 Tax=Fusarium torulosum TaxID=33205 RepID=A0AAE8MMV3_9HYPO|nr:uncharacterized protein FTOL_13675 [Fusarium torulosum]